MGQMAEAVPRDTLMINYDIDSVNIPVVTKQHGDSYILKSSSSDASLWFRLQVEGIIILLLFTQAVK